MAETAIDVLVGEHDSLEELFKELRQPEADRVEVWANIVRKIATHVAVERTFVYPLIKRHRVGPDLLAAELRHDYSGMEHILVLTERRKINSPDMPDLVSELLDIFDAHRDRCSTVLAPTLREILSEVELERLGGKMRGAENVILSHPHPHLLATGPLYQLTTRIASRWDRVRDRTVRNR